ncbi:MAG: tRNA (adenosine(37)-N6)-dimethylallyltransferase MiaA [Bacteroidales bacterium]|jgi:tRNA dimethylallyltransferase|nr:tRNA (adenosine(37)-N6)-dimethylallyltransferase MiaA [Bacteroidales bacterium]
MIVVLGPTAIGKTRFATLIADKLDGEIISADSRQVYRKMNIGTGKDLDDYTVNGKNIPYYLIDIVDPDYEYNVFEFKRDFYKAYEDITNKNKKVILCGGSGMYLQSVLSNYKLTAVPINKKLREKLEAMSDGELVEKLSNMKKLHNHTDTGNRERLIRAIEIEEHQALYENDDEYRLIIPEIIVGLKDERDVVRNRITQRLKTRLNEENLIDEVEQLLDSGIDSEKLKWFGLEYKFITMYLLGEISYYSMFEKLNTAIHQFSKRQMTWFKRMERQGFDIHWINSSLEDEEKINIFFEKYSYLCQLNK